MLLESRYFALAALLALAGVERAHAGSVAYQTQVLANGPLVYLGMDETSGTSAADATGNGHTGTYGSGVTVGQSSAGPNLVNSVLSDGLTTPVTIGGSAAFDGIGTGDFTAEVWFNTSNVSSREDVFTFKGGSSDLGLHLGSQDAGQLSIYHNGFVGESSISGGVTANTWHLAALVRSGGTDTVYYDGTAVASGLDGASVNTSGSAIEVGSNTGALFLTGKMDEFAFFGSALTPSQITADYNVGLAAVPEPATLVLFSLGAIGLLAVARRRRSA